MGYSSSCLFKTVLIKQRLANESIVAELKMTKEIGRVIVALKMKAFQYEKNVNTPEPMKNRNKDEDFNRMVCDGKVAEKYSKKNHQNKCFGDF